MVLPAKIFEIKEKADMGFMLQKLRDFREEMPYKTESGESINLVTEILDLKFEDGTISGVFAKDFVGTRFYKRRLVETLVTEEAPFWIRPFEDRIFLIVLAPSTARGVKRLLTGNVANTLSRILFIKRGAIVETRIPHETLREMHESNPQATRLIWFDQVDIPGVEKLCLAGSDIADTGLYQEYLKHGKIWYVVFEVQKYGLVLGITRNSVVTLFSKSTLADFVKYIQDEILKIIE